MAKLFFILDGCGKLVTKENIDFVPESMFLMVIGINYFDCFLSCIDMMKGYTVYDLLRIFCT